jgi:hypothetical protein
MRKYQRNRVPSRDDDVTRREEPKRERFLAQIGAQLSKLGNAPATPPALQVPSPINPPGVNDLDQFWKLDGRPGGQHGRGGTGAGQSATISSTLHSTKGFVFFGAGRLTAYDETLERVGINVAAPLARLHLKHLTGSGTQTVLPSSANIGGSWGVTGGPPQPANSILSTNDGSTTIVQSGTGSDLDCTIPMSAFSAPTSGTWTLRIVAARNGALVNGIGVVIANTANFAAAVDGPFTVPTSMTLAPTYTAFDFTISAVGKANLVQSSWFVILRAGASNANTINVTQVILTTPASLTSTPLLRLSNLALDSDLNFASGSDAVDLNLSGTPALMIASGPSAASGVRLYSTASAGRIEFGSAASALLAGVLSGQAGAVASSIKLSSTGTLISNAAVASLIAAGALLDLFPVSDLKVLKLRPHSSQTNEILVARNNADSSTLAAIDSTGKIVANIGLQLNAQTPAAGKIATSSDGVGNFTWSLAAAIAATWAYVAKTANYTITTSDGVIDCTSGTFTVTLPTAVGVAGRMYAIKNSGTGVITLATTSSQTIDGSLTASIPVSNMCLVVVSDGANWKVI